MTNRWKDDDNDALADQLTHAADYLADEEGRSDNDLTVEALREAAERLEMQDALKRGRITTWHAEQVTAGQLRAYLEGVAWAGIVGQQPGQTRHEVCQPMPGTNPNGGTSPSHERHWMRAGQNYIQWDFRVISDDAYEEHVARYHYEAIQSIAAIEDRGELAVFLDVMSMEDANE